MTLLHPSTAVALLAVALAANGCATADLPQRRPADDPSNPAAPEAPLAPLPSLSGLPASLASASPEAAPSGPVTYTCPMHPEVTRDAPGRCPTCGMNLVPRPKAEGGEPAPQMDHGGHTGHGAPGHDGHDGGAP